MTLPLCPMRRLYLKEKARKARRDAKLIDKARAEYDRLCAAHKIAPRETKAVGKNVCTSCQQPTFGTVCMACRKANPELNLRNFKARVHTANKRIAKRGKAA